MPRRSERPTTPPLFDVIKYAQDSDARIKAQPLASAEESAQETPSSETRLATRPNMGATITDEAWARTIVGTPRIVMASDELRRLPLDHRAGFLLSLMDGTIDLPTVIEVSAMSHDDALRVVRDLFEAGVVVFRSR
jgi:hypothetical protein